jgi:hypothetical protein
LLEHRLGRERRCRRTVGAGHAGLGAERNERRPARPERDCENAAGHVPALGAPIGP